MILYCGGSPQPEVLRVGWKAFGDLVVQILHLLEQYPRQPVRGDLLHQPWPPPCVKPLHPLFPNDAPDSCYQVRVHSRHDPVCEHHLRLHIFAYNKKTKTKKQWEQIVRLVFE